MPTEQYSYDLSNTVSVIICKVQLILKDTEDERLYFMKASYSNIKMKYIDFT